jgi:signal transduction histidine kinase
MLFDYFRSWQKHSLVRQFITAALLVLVPTMAIVGWWISSRLTDALIDNTATTIVIYMDGVVASFVPEIQSTGNISPSTIRKLDSVLAPALSDASIVSMKIWKLDGTIMYSSFPEMIGKKYEQSDAFKLAMNGKLAADFDGTPEAENINERNANVRLLEVYAPVHELNSRQIIAVSEFYVNGTILERDVAKAWWTSWLVVALTTAILIFLLSAFLRRDSRIILNQQAILNKKIYELEDALKTNEGLQEKLRDANGKLASVNERVLQQVGADLHDGPAQMLAYAAVRLSSFQKLANHDKTLSEQFLNFRRILADAMQGIRIASSGLMLPGLENASLKETIALAIKNHKESTNTDVEFLAKGEHFDFPAAYKICAYRFVQEGLTNAFKHAQGKGQKIFLQVGDHITLEVCDEGVRSFPKTPRAKGLGLMGMRARVEALGGNLEIIKPKSGGTILRATLPLNSNSRLESN